MKKLICFLLVLAMLLAALGACGGKTVENTTEPSGVIPEHTTTSPSVSEEKTGDTTEESTEAPSEFTGIDSPYIDTIIAANSLANGVQQHAGGYRWKYKDET